MSMDRDVRIRLDGVSKSFPRRARLPRSRC